jgi:hypothetical protein
VSTWFDALKGLRRLDMPRFGMRLLVELAMLPGIGAPDSAGPWFVWLRYFVANEAVDFAPNSKHAADQLIRQCRRFMRGTKEEQAAIVLLLSEALSRPSNERDLLIPPVIATWLDPAALAEAMQKARTLGRNEHHYVSLDESLALWTFLHAVHIDTSPATITIDLREAKRRMSGITRMRFAEDIDEGIPAELSTITASVQSVYRAWGLREPELEKLRPYFGRDDLRGKIRPLEVVRTGRERDPEPPRPPPPQPHQRRFSL